VVLNVAGVQYLYDIKPNKMKKTEKKFKPIKSTEPLPKILQVRKEASNASWMKHLPTPLKENEKVFVEPDQKGVTTGYVRVKHGNPKVISIFSLGHFTRPMLKTA